MYLVIIKLHNLVFKNYLAHVMYKKRVRQMQRNNNSEDFVMFNRLLEYITGQESAILLQFPVETSFFILASFIWAKSDEVIILIKRVPVSTFSC